MPTNVAILIIQKNLDPKDERPEDLSATESKLLIKKFDIISAPKWDSPTVPKPIDSNII